MSISQLRLTIITILVLFTGVIHADDFPARSATLVTDFVGILSEENRLSLENKLVAFNDSTSTQIAVVLMRSTGNFEIADYSVQLFNKWKIGQASKNNGVLILAATDDRKVWITTGYGIEGVLPDVLCKRIVENEIVPLFKLGDYSGGLEAATNSIMSIVKGEYTAADYLKTGKKSKPVFFPFLIFIFIIIVTVLSRFGKVNRYARRNNLAFWAAWALLNAATSRSRGSYGGFSGGGSFGGGGFGGFGGGMSGGGGAGGSW